MKNFTTKIAVYDASTQILIDIYTFSSVSRSQQLNDMQAMTNVKKEYRESRLAKLSDKYSDVIYRLAEDGLLNPLQDYTFEIL